MTTTNTFVGIGEEQRVSSRVLKPPGGGSSFSFDGEDDFMKPRAKVAPMQQQQPQQQDTPKVESNGTETPQTDSSVATKDPTPAPTTNGTPATNGTATNGTDTNGTPTTTTTNGTPASPSTVCSSPSSARLDTQSRLFGEAASREQNWRGTVRDHQRSNIFAEPDVKTNGAPSKAATPTAGSTPESKTPEQPQPQQKQRIPPGGFSTKLW